MSTGWKVLIGCTIAAGMVFAVLYFTKKSAAAYFNEETWTWVDYKGNQRTLTVTRNAKVEQIPGKI